MPSLESVVHQQRDDERKRNESHRDVPRPERRDPRAERQADPNQPPFEPTPPIRRDPSNRGERLRREKVPRCPRPLAESRGSSVPHRTAPARPPVPRLAPSSGTRDNSLSPRESSTQLSKLPSVRGGPGPASFPIRPFTTTVGGSSDESLVGKSLSTPRTASAPCRAERVAGSGVRGRSRREPRSSAFTG